MDRGFSRGIAPTRHADLDAMRNSGQFTDIPGFELQSV